MRITIFDWLIIVVFTLGLILLGYLTRRFTKGVADFVIAGRKLRMWLGLSTGSAEGLAIASVVMLGQQGFLHGFSYIWLPLFSMMVTVPLIGIYGFGIKRYRATGVQTLPQYYEMRYSRGVRILAGIAISLGGILNMAIFPIVSAQFLTTFLGFAETVNVLGINIRTVHIIMLFVIGLPLFFVLAGGFVTVVITNYVESILMAVTVFSITFLAIKNIGGMTIEDTINRMHTSITINLGQDAFNPFATGNYGIIWILFYIAVQIYMSLAFPPSLAITSGAESPEVARKMYLIRTITNNGRFMCILLWGIAAMVVMGVNVPAGVDTELYQRTVTPLFLKSIVPPVLLGVSVAGLLFAEIATVSGYILSWSSIVVNDVVCSIRRNPFNNIQHIRVLRITAVLIALFLFMWGIYYKPTESVLTYMYLTGAIFTGAGIISYYGLYSKKTTTLAAYLTLLICIIVPLTDILLKQHWEKITFLRSLSEHYPLKGEQSGLLAIVLSMLTIHVISFFSGKNQNFVDYGTKVKDLENINKDNLMLKQDGRI